MNEELKNLDKTLHESLKPLNARQRRFVEVYATGSHSQASAAIEAGYSAKTASPMANRLLKKVSVKHAVDVLRQRYALEHGFSAAWKREQLADTYRQARGLEQPSAATQTLRTILEMDGDIGSSRRGTESGLVVHFNIEIPPRSEEIIGGGD